MNEGGLNLPVRVAISYCIKLMCIAPVAHQINDDAGYI